MCEKHVFVRTITCGLFPLFTCILFLTLVLVADSSCPFRPTHQYLQNECDFSQWLPWDCTCCGSDTSTYYLAKRQRGICCKPGEPVKHCLVRCNYTVNDDTDYGHCGTSCSVTSTPSPCPYEKTTTGINPTTITGPTRTENSSTSSPTTKLTTSSTSTVTTLNQTTTARVTNVTATLSSTTTASATRITTTAIEATSTTKAPTTSVPTSSSSLPTAQTSTDSTGLNVTLRVTKNTIPILVGATTGCMLAACLPTCCIICLCKKKKRKEKQDRVRKRKLSYHVGYTGDQPCLTNMSEKTQLKFV